MSITDQQELEELARSINDLIQDNRKFLEKVLDEDFEPDEAVEEEAEETFEEL
jgi:hypothetical protein